MARPKRERKKVEVAVKDDSDDDSADDTLASRDRQEGGEVDTSSNDSAVEGSSSESEDETGEDNDASPLTDTAEPWSVKWSKTSGNCWAQDKHGDWYEAKIVDVISQNDPRWAQITDENVQSKRGLKARAAKLSEFSMTEG